MSPSAPPDFVSVYDKNKLKCYEIKENYCQNQARRKRCGMVAVVVPNICREKIKRKKESTESKRGYYGIMGVEHPLGKSNNYKRYGIWGGGGAGKRQKKRQKRLEEI